MAGITDLMAGQGSAPMPPKQPNTPASVVGNLKAQISQMLSSGMSIGDVLSRIPSSTNVWATLSAISDITKQENAKKAVQNQMAMASGAQQSPNVKQEVIQQAEQTFAPKMAATGGLMRAYNNGGAVAFDGGGDVEIRRILNKSPLMRTPEENEKLRAAGIELTSRKFAPTYSSGIDEALTAEKIRLETEKARAPKIMTAQQLEALVQPAPTAMTPQQVEGAVRPAQPESAYSSGIDAALAAERARRAAQSRSGESQVQQPPAAQTTAATSAQPSDIEKELRAVEEERRRAIEASKALPPGAIAAREQYDKLVQDIIEGNKVERERLGKRAEERYGEAKARAAAKPFDDLQYLSAMLGGMKGTKRFGEGLAGAVSGMGAEQARRQDALRKAEETYDLKQGELFRLQTAQQQVAMDQAKLNEARATGDKDRIDKAAMDLAASKENAAKLSFEVRQKIEKTEIDKRQVAAQEMSARAALASAGKLTGPEFLYNMYRKDPEAFKKFIEAQQGPKGDASIVKAIVAEVVKNPLMLNQYPPEIQALVKDEIAKLRGTTPSAADPLGLR